MYIHFYISNSTRDKHVTSFPNQRVMEYLMIIITTTTTTRRRQQQQQQDNTSNFNFHIVYFGTTRDTWTLVHLFWNHGDYSSPIILTPGSSSPTAPSIVIDVFFYFRSGSCKAGSDILQSLLQPSEGFTQNGGASEVFFHSEK